MPRPLRCPPPLLISAAALGCRPPEAPARLEALCSWLFGHMDDEDPEALAEGVTQLGAWLDRNREDAQGGYEVDRLSADDVRALPGPARSVDGLTGASVATTISAPVQRVMRTIAMGDATEIYGDTYLSYRRDWDRSPDCFVEGRCERASGITESTADYTLFTVDSRFRVELRWVETERGTAALQRTWLLDPIDVLGVQTVSQYYLAATLPHRGGAERLQAVWIDIETSLPIPEATALQQAIDSMQTTDAQLEDWLR
jgi:hypothetical protein